MALLDDLREAGLDIKIGAMDPNEIKICCPFCTERGTSPDFKYRLGINLESGLGNCFNCGWSSRQAFLEVVRIYGLGDETVAQIEEIQFTQKTKARPTPAVLPADFQLLAEVDANDEMDGPALAYAFKRGITREQMKRHEIGASFNERRIIFPIRAEDGTLWGHIGRDYTGQNWLRYLYSKSLKAMWNAKLYTYPEDMVIISEGAVKALAIERAIHNKYCSAGLGGNSIQDTKLAQIKGFREAILFPDPDVPGMEGFLRVASNLDSQFKKVTMVWPWPTKQADDMTPKEIRELLRNRVLMTPVVKIGIKRQMLRRKMADQAAKI